VVHSRRCIHHGSQGWFIAKSKDTCNVFLCCFVSCLQDIEPFAQPKVQLEQYPTGADIASRMLYTVSVQRRQQCSSTFEGVGSNAVGSDAAAECSRTAVVLQAL
jgi:hypothetical protein